jgi:hypothetical protein
MGKRVPIMSVPSPVGAMVSSAVGVVRGVAGGVLVHPLRARASISTAAVSGLRGMGILWD